MNERQIFSAVVFVAYLCEALSYAFLFSLCTFFRGGSDWEWSWFIVVFLL